VNTVDPPLTIWTGFHWCSPVVNASSDTAESLLSASTRWGAVIIVGASPNGTDTGFTYACDRVMDAREANQGGRSLDQCIARVFYFTSNPPVPTYGDVSSVQTADSWLQTNGYYNSLDYFVGNGGRNIILFNELDIPGESQHSIDPRTMGCLSYAVKQHFLQSRSVQVFTLFPGPSANPDQGYFNTYWNQYALRDASGSLKTYAFVYGGQVDPAIAANTVLWNNGTGIFDRTALHCYATNPAEFSNASPASNRALRFIQWMLTIDPTGWIYVTECGGQCPQGDLCPDNVTSCFGDSACADASLADYQSNVSNLNSQAIGNGGFGNIVQAVYGYILDQSNADANSNGKYKINSVFMSGYNNERRNLFP
jgi:hypothetical protein